MYGWLGLEGQCPLVLALVFLAWDNEPLRRFPELVTNQDMILNHHFLIRGGRLFLLVALFGLSTGCQKEAEEAEAEDSAPQEVSSEGLELSPEAQEAVGLETVQVRLRETQATMRATGWLAVRPGSEIVVKAPITGFITREDTSPLALGQAVSENQLLAKLHAFLSPQEQAQLVMAKEEADILIKQSAASLELAEEQLARLERDAASTVAGTRLLDLRETIARSRAAEQEAREKLPFLPKEPYEGQMQLKETPLTAPLSGQVVGLHFTPGQLVLQGDPLWTIGDWSSLWVRVPVYVADVPKVLAEHSVDVRWPNGNGSMEAHPIKSPQATEPGKQTIALFYEIENSEGKLRPGQAVSVSLPTGQNVSQPVLPKSAILWDGLGNSWVYLRTLPTTFRRQKVELGQLLAKEVVVERGLEVGDTVVITGAEALYGEEFRSQIQSEDDD